MKLEFKKVSDFKRGILVELLKQGYSFDCRYEQAYLQKWKENDDFFFDHLHIADKYCFITTLEDEPIGFITWDPRHLPEYAEIGDNCIIPKYKGKGYGKLQLQETISRIKLNKVKKIIVMTNEDLAAAQRNYESVGFKEVRRWEDQSWSHIDYEIIVENKIM